MTKGSNVRSWASNARTKRVNVKVCGVDGKSKSLNGRAKALNRKAPAPADYKSAGARRVGIVQLYPKGKRESEKISLTLHLETNKKPHNETN